MYNFEFLNPTKILFGRGQIAAIGREIGPDETVLLTYGSGSIQKNGVYEQVMKALEGRRVFEFGGIEPNPDYDTLMKAVELARREKVTMLLAAGGGSVVDGTKFIAAAVPYAGDPWEILAQAGKVESALPLGCVLTLPATGSEANEYAVVSRASMGEKLAFGSKRVYPRFSVLDPETTFTLPPRQIANGVVDAFAHTLEQYLTFPVSAHLQDRFAESILQTLIEVGPQTLARPDDYDTRATFVWTATMALNGLIGAGVPQDWSTHMIGHELTALYGIDHARTLAVVLPHLWRVRRAGKRAKLLQYADRVWCIRAGSGEERIDKAIRRTEDFFESLGVPTRLAAYNVKSDTPDTVAGRLERRGATKLSETQDLGPDHVREILSRSLVSAA